MKTLHSLIHSLTQSEKRYVKLRLNANKANSDMIKHFDVLAKQTEYDLSKISKDYPKSTKLLQTNLRKLYDVVLKHLRSFNADKNSENILQGMLIDISTLKEKGMINDAFKKNQKLIELASQEENFEILKKAYSDLWIFHHLKGQLSPEKTKEVEELLKENQEREIELAKLDTIYRAATTIYYQYFFHNRDEAYRNDIKELNKANSQSDLKSAKAKHIYFETKAMEYMIWGDIKNHHEIRKEQLHLLFASSVFKADYLSKILVLSNVFTYLKSTGAINELAAYLKFMNDYFRPVLEKNQDGVLLEKFYDIYFQNNLFLQAWKPNKTEINQLIQEVDVALKKGLNTNQLLVSRTHLGLAEILILTGEYKMAIPHLVEFQDLLRDKKYSKPYIESDLHFIALYHFMNKWEVFENSLRSLTNKIRVHEIVLDEEQQTLFDAFKAIQKDKSIEANAIEKINYKMAYKAYILRLDKKCSMDDARSKFFTPKNHGYSLDEDDFLTEIISLSQRG